MHTGGMTVLPLWRWKPNVRMLTARKMPDRLLRTKGWMKKGGSLVGRGGEREFRLVHLAMLPKVAQVVGRMSAT